MRQTTNKLSFIVLVVFVVTTVLATDSGWRSFAVAGLGQVRNQS